MTKHIIKAVEDANARVQYDIASDGYNNIVFLPVLGDVNPIDIDNPIVGQKVVDASLNDISEYLDGAFANNKGWNGFKSLKEDRKEILLEMVNQGCASMLTIMHNKQNFNIISPDTFAKSFEDNVAECAMIESDVVNLPANITLEDYLTWVNYHELGHALDDSLENALNVYGKNNPDRLEYQSHVKENFADLFATAMYVRESGDFLIPEIQSSSRQLALLNCESTVHFTTEKLEPFIDKLHDIGIYNLREMSIDAVVDFAYRETFELSKDFDLKDAEDFAKHLEKYEDDYYVLKKMVIDHNSGKEDYEFLDNNYDKHYENLIEGRSSAELEEHLLETESKALASYTANPREQRRVLELEIEDIEATGEEKRSPWQQKRLEVLQTLGKNLEQNMEEYTKDIDFSFELAPDR